MDIIGNRLRDLREEKNVKQAEVASALGITQQIYSNYELGKRDLPLRHLIVLADFYGVSTDYILGRIAYPKIPSEFTHVFIPHVTIGAFVCRIESFTAKSKSQLIDYVNYLSYLESKKKLNE
ncbi:MAG: helix-turn-helix transcriptional regulator [Clostridium sp.]